MPCGSIIAPNWAGGGGEKQTRVCQQQNGCCDSVVHMMAYSTTVKMGKPQQSIPTWLNLKN